MLGATHVLARETVPLSSLVSEVKKITSAPVKLAYDSVSEADTQAAAYDVLAPGGQIVLLWPFVVDESKHSNDKEVILVFGNVHPPAQRALGVGLYKNLTELLRTGAIKVRNIMILPVYIADFSESSPTM